MILRNGEIASLEDIKNLLPSNWTQAEPSRRTQSITIDLRALKDMERDIVIEVLRQVDGDRYEACHLLGISYTTLWRRLTEWGVPF